MTVSDAVSLVLAYPALASSVAFFVIGYVLGFMSGSRRRRPPLISQRVDPHF